MKTNELTDVINSRISTNLIMIINNICKKNCIHKSEFVEMALIEFLSSNINEENFKIEIKGLDIDRYIISYKKAMLRKFEGKIRNGIISSATFYSRFVKDLRKLIFFEASLDMIEDYFDSRRREAKLHDNADELLRRIAHFKKPSRLKLEKWKQEIDTSYYEKKYNTVDYKQIRKANKGVGK